MEEIRQKPTVEDVILLLTETVKEKFPEYFQYSVAETPRESVRKKKLILCEMMPLLYDHFWLEKTAIADYIEHRNIVRQVSDLLGDRIIRWRRLERLCVEDEKRNDTGRK